MKTAGKTSRKSARENKKSAREKVAPCKRPGYINPAINKKYTAALREMKREGIKPAVTSTWRSSAHQAQLHQCSHNRKCRLRNPGLYAALPAGRSLHEAGFAVDISGVAVGPRGAKRLTPRGRQIIKIMQKNGFKWRYGLADPAHFEADPRKHGYQSVRQAINRSQSVCEPPLLKSSQKAIAKRSLRKNRTASASKRQRPQKRDEVKTASGKHRRRAGA